MNLPVPYRKQESFFGPVDEAIPVWVDIGEGGYGVGADVFIEGTNSVTFYKADGQRATEKEVVEAFSDT